MKGLTHEDHSGLSIFGDLCHELHGPGGGVALGGERVERFLLIIKIERSGKKCVTFRFFVEAVAMESLGKQRKQRLPPYNKAGEAARMLPLSVGLRRLLLCVLMRPHTCLLSGHESTAPGDKGTEW